MGVLKRYVNPPRPPMWPDMVSVGSGGPIGPSYMGVLVGDMVLEGALRGHTGL